MIGIPNVVKDEETGFVRNRLSKTVARLPQLCGKIGLQALNRRSLPNDDPENAVRKCLLRVFFSREVGGEHRFADPAHASQPDNHNRPLRAENEIL